MSVLLKVCVGVVTAALLAGPDLARAGDFAVPGLGSGSTIFDRVERQIERRTHPEYRRNSVTAVSDLPPFRLGRVERDRSRSVEGRVRPYVSPGRKLGVKKQRLPDRCLRVIETRRGDRLAYSARCLDRSYRHAKKLPRDCRVRVRDWRESTVVYGSACLADDGWRVARR